MTTTRPPSHLGLRHLALNVRDPEASREFYMRVMQMQLEWKPDADNIYLTSAGQDNLALHRAKAERGPTGQSLDHLGFIARTADDVDAWAEWIKSQGITLSAPPKTHRDGARSFYFSDPDGNSVQMIFHPPIARTGSQQP